MKNIYIVAKKYNKIKEYQLNKYLFNKLIK